MESKAIAQPAGMCIAGWFMWPFELEGRFAQKTKQKSQLAQSPKPADPTERMCETLSSYIHYFWAL